ncbi:MAG TPA: hypothetical protein EYN06_02670, partial [Myxococcales bacterium]|nr:hypothetical protein [Myxococcales bacterium]
IGICKSGTRECKQGQWGHCQGDKKPILDGPDSPAGCDGFDNDCDGGVDEGCPCESGIKICGSITGQCQNGIQQCQNGHWSECQWGTIAVSVWPEPEICDGKDNDCDGHIDNQPGTTAPLVTVCGDFDLALAGIGQCTAGTKGCDSPCEGAVGPEDELCADNVDNDCDGLPDEGCSCEPVQPKNCGPSIGVCSPGIQSCGADVWSSECAGAVLPSPELCDGIDNDCDGLVDNVPGTHNPIAHSCWDLSIDPDSLKVGLGVCGVGNRRCYGSLWGPCVDQAGPSLDFDGNEVEQCDGKDNDCDGSVDEMCDCSDSPETTSCGSSVGACSLGTQKCVAGQRAACVGASLPKVEECNGIDDNCDGLADLVVGGTTLKRGCYAGPSATLAYGECSLGARSCIQGSYSVCESQVMPVAEICNGLDDDCDGVTDEGCACADGATQPCGSDQGSCESGVSLCVDLQWSELCMGAQHAEIEDCNGLDDDCDGKVDNQQDSDKKINTSCYTGPPLTRAIGECKAGIRKCGITGNWTSCVGQQLPASEDFCGDELDNDCDGVVDEGCDCDSTLTPTRACGLNTGACTEGEQLCQDSLWSATCSGSLPTTENCNGLDDDCDGRVDVNPSNDRKLAQSCYDGGAFTEGVGPCKAGKRLCVAGQYSGPCLGQHTPAPGDICGNDQDDDCNSLTDVDCPVGN